MTAPSGSTGTPSSPPPESTASRAPVRRRQSRAGLYTVVAVVLIVLVLVGVGYGTNWYGLTKSSSSTAPCSSGITLQGDGAQIAVPLMGVWTPTFQGDTNNMVNYPGSGSGTGLTHFTQKTVDFAVTDDPLTPAERSALPSSALTLPFVGGALTLIYNLPGVSGHLNLTGSILVGIYNGTITKWNDPALVAANPGVSLPSNTIVPVIRSDSAGTTYVLSDFLTQSSSWWASNVGKGISIQFPKVTGELGEHGNSLVISTVVKTSYSIGYSDLTDVLTASSPPQYAAIQNPKGNYIVPTIANTESALLDKVGSMAALPSSAGDWFNVSMVKANGTNDYPIATFLYMFVYRATDQGLTPTLAKSQVLVQWFNWVFTTGQPLADETQPTPLYYAPLPSTVVTVDEAGLSTMTFNGAAIPACK